jgi:multidrug efflux pump subunit AcrA (membrane-fusion protein)
VAAGGLGAARLPAQEAQFPRLQAAITALNDAIDFMEKAPNDFGGHKAAALSASRAAIRQLQAAMNYRRRGGRD